MKKTTAILLIVIHVMSVIASYGIFAELQLQGQRFSRQLDEDEYVGSDAITLKMPITLPYPVESNSYERVEGKFFYEGSVYQRVKQKIHRDTLYVVCVKDSKSTELTETLQDYATAIADHPSKTSPKGKIATIGVEEFECAECLYINRGTFLIKPIRLPGYSFSEILNSNFQVDQPPRI